MSDWSRLYSLIQNVRFNKFRCFLFVIKISVIDWVFFVVKILRSIWIKFIAKIYLNWSLFCFHAVIKFSLGTLWMQLNRSNRWLNIHCWSLERASLQFCLLNFVKMMTAPVVGVHVFVSFVLVLMTICQEWSLAARRNTCTRPTWLVYHYLIITSEWCIFC